MSDSRDASRRDIIDGCSFVGLGGEVGDWEINGGGVVGGLEEGELW